MKTYLLVTIGLISMSGCHRSGYSPQSNTVTARNAAPEKPAVNQDVASLCQHISSMKVYPMKNEKGVDGVYDAFREAGDSAVPCLIEKVADKTEIEDPRQVPRTQGTVVRVGDIAYFLIVDIENLDFTELFPARVKSAYREKGVDAYFDYIRVPEHRRALQKSLDAWYKAKKEASGTSAQNQK